MTNSRHAKPRRSDANAIKSAYSVSRSNHAKGSKNQKKFLIRSRLPAHAGSDARHERAKSFGRISYAPIKYLFQEFCPDSECLEISNETWLVGRFGVHIRGMLASLGVRSPFLTLHFRQAATTFSHASPPPLERGRIWSMVRSCRRSPQYWQV